MLHSVNQLEILLKACLRYVIDNIPFRAHVTPHRISLGWLSANRRREYFTAMQAYNKSLATSNPSYVENRFSRVGNHTTLRCSERHPALTLYCNFSRPERANCCFMKATTDLLNGLNVSSYYMSELKRFKQDLTKLSLKETKSLVEIEINK